MWVRLSSVCLVLLMCSGAGPSEFGQFRSPLIVKGVAEKERIVELVAPFSFQDPKGKIWTVPPGARVDGASIPQAFWSVIGGPFEGKYREASVIHDYFCDKKRESWQSTHMVFYQGMRANGVDESSAKLMYGAVYRFGPRWVTVKEGGRIKIVTGASIDLNELANDPNVTVDEVRRAVDEALHVDLSDMDALRDLPGCSVAAEPLRGSKTPTVLCGLASDARKLLAKRNLSILATDVRTLLSGNDSLLLPLIEEYLRRPTEENWSAVTKSSEEVLNLVNLTMISLIQYDEAFHGKATAVGERFQTARLYEIVKARSIMLEENRLQGKRGIEKMRSWRRVYLEVLRHLRQELAALEPQIR